MWMGGWELSNYGQIYHQSNAKFWPDRAKFHPYILSYDHMVRLCPDKAKLCLYERVNEAQ